MVRAARVSVAWLKSKLTSLSTSMAAPTGGQPSERDRGMYRGRAVGRVLSSPDGLLVLVGKSAKDNDTLTTRLTRPYDLWFHVAGQSGSHVVVLNDQRLDRRRDYHG